MTENTGVLLAASMKQHDDFEATAQQILGLIRAAATDSPGSPRHLVLDIEGHRNGEGGFDQDAFEIQRHFILGMVMRYLTTVTFPLAPEGRRNKAPQRDDIPATVEFTPADTDVDALAARASESGADLYVADAGSYLVEQTGAEQ